MVSPRWPGVPPHPFPQGDPVADATGWFAPAPRRGAPIFPGYT